MSRAPRALFCTDTYPPQVNGVSVVTALSVAGLLARGWEVEVVAPAYPPVSIDPFEHEHAEGGIPAAPVTAIASVPLPLYPDIRLAAPAAARIAGVIDAFAPDLVHSATEFVIGRLGQLLALRKGIPVTSSYHTDFSRYADAYGAPWLRPSVTRYIGRFHCRSQRVYTPSAPARDDLLRLGVRDAEVWGRGVDIETFHPARRSEPLRESYGDRDTCLLLHVGRLAAEKGVERILEAWAIARSQLPDHSAHLIVAGSGPRERELRHEAPDGITFLGNLDRRHVLPRLYASCDAFLFASLTETLGLVVLEAMASGLPVIATPAGGVADHLRDGDNGIAFPAGDVGAMAHAIVTIVMDRDRRRALSLGARRTAEELSWSAELDRLDASYRQVIERPTAHPARLMQAAG